MEKRLLFVLLGSILLLQCLYAYPEKKSASSSSSSSSSSSEEEKEKSNKVNAKKSQESGEESVSSEEEEQQQQPKKKEKANKMEENKYSVLKQFALNESKHLTNIKVVEGAKIFEAVLAEIDVLDKTKLSTNWSMYLKEIHAFVDEAKKKVLSYDSLANSTTNLIDKFNATKQEKLDPEILVIEMSMKRHGIDDLKIKLEKDFIDFTNKFSIEVEKYIVKLTTDEEKEKEHEFIEWFNSFKAATDVTAKKLIFDKFFHFVGDSTIKKPNSLTQIKEEEPVTAENNKAAVEKTAVTAEKETVTEEKATVTTEKPAVTTEK